MNNCMVLAKVRALKGNSLSYPCCKQCNSKILQGTTNDRWTCGRCVKEYSSSNLPYRFRVCFNVTDGHSHCDVTVFGSNLDSFFGLSATQFKRFCDDCEPRLPNELTMEALLETSLKDVFVAKFFYFGFKTERLPRPANGSSITLAAVLDAATDKQYNFTGVPNQESEIQGMVAWQMQSVLDYRDEPRVTVSQTMRTAVQAIVDSHADVTASPSDMSDYLSSFLTSRNASGINASSTRSQGNQTLTDQSASTVHPSNESAMGGRDVTPWCHTMMVTPQMPSGKRKSSSTDEAVNSFNYHNRTLSDTITRLSKKVRRHTGGEGDSTPSSGVEQRSPGDDMETPDLTFVNVTRGSSRTNTASSSDWRKVDFSFELDSDSSFSQSQPSQASQTLDDWLSESNQSVSSRTSSTTSSSSTYSAHISQLFDQLLAKAPHTRRKGLGNKASKQLDKPDSGMCAPSPKLKSHIASVTPARKVDMVDDGISACSRVIKSQIDSATPKHSRTKPNRGDTSQLNDETIELPPPTGRTQHVTDPESVSAAGVYSRALEPSPTDVVSSGETSLQQTLDNTEIYLEHYRNGTVSMTQTGIDSMHSVMEPAQVSHLTFTQTQSDASDCDSLLLRHCAEFGNMSIHEGDGALVTESEKNTTSRRSVSSQTGSTSRSQHVEELPYSEKLSAFLDDMNESDFCINDSDLEAAAALCELSGEPSSAAPTEGRALSGEDSSAPVSPNHVNPPPNSEDMFGNSVCNSETCEEDCIGSPGDKLLHVPVHVESDDTRASVNSQPRASDKAARVTTPGRPWISTKVKPVRGISRSTEDALDFSTPDIGEDDVDGDTSLLRLAKVNYTGRRRRSATEAAQKFPSTSRVSGADDVTTTKSPVSHKPPQHAATRRRNAGRSQSPGVSLSHANDRRNGESSQSPTVDSAHTVCDSQSSDTSAAGSCDMFAGSQSMFDSDEEIPDSSDEDFNVTSTSTPVRSVQFSQSNQSEVIPVIDTKMRTTPPPSTHRKPRRSCLRKSVLIKRAIRFSASVSPVPGTTHVPKLDDTTGTTYSEDLFSDAGSSPPSSPCRNSPHGSAGERVSDVRRTPVGSDKQPPHARKSLATQPLSSIENVIYTNSANSSASQQLDETDFIEGTPSPVVKCFNIFGNRPCIPKGILMFGTRNNRTNDAHLNKKLFKTEERDSIFESSSDMASQSMFSDDSVL